MLQNDELELGRCPHCGIALPRLSKVTHFQSWNSAKTLQRFWAVYSCSSCGGVVTTASLVSMNGPIEQQHPKGPTFDLSIPEKPRTLLEQAASSPTAGAVLLAASSVDSMLRAKGLKEGSLYERIKKAADEHLITPEMGTWAHEVRIGANDQRHPGEETEIPSPEEARRSIAFVTALGQFLFVLPALVKAGRELRDEKTPAEAIKEAAAKARA